MHGRHLAYVVFGGCCAVTPHRGATIATISCSVIVLWRCHHKLAELFKVHGAAAVLVDFGDDSVEFRLGELGIHLRQDAAERLHRDEALEQNERVRD
jgi:hypothetical protein